MYTCISVATATKSLMVADDNTLWGPVCFSSIVYSLGFGLSVLG